MAARAVIGRRARQASPAGLGILVLAVAVGTTCALAAHRGHGFLDLAVYRFGGEAVLAHWPLYDVAFEDGARRLPFTYPPFAALVMTALAPVPLPLLAAVWSLLGVLALAVTVLLFWREWPLSVPSYAVPLVVVLALAAEPVWSSLAYGQVNLMLMLGVVVDLLRNERRLAGLLIGIAAGVKLTPLVFVVLLVLVGRHRAAVTALAGFVATVVLGFVLLPVTSWAYWTEVLWDPGRVGGVAFASNQSVLGASTRLLGAQPSTGVWLVLAGALGLATLLVAAARWRRGDRDIAVGLAGMAMLLASPISWSHHWVWVVPLAVALARVAPWPVPALWAVVFVSGCVRLPRSSDDVELTWQPWEQVVGSGYLVAGLVLVVALAPLPWRGKGAAWPSRPPASTGTPARSRTPSSRTSMTG